MKKISLLIIIILIVVLLILLVDIERKNVDYVKINNQKIIIEVADTSEERTKGLMLIESLDENAGMLFIFDKPDIQTFWMKNTLINLDIIFIDEEMKIIKILRNAVPCLQDICEYYSSDTHARYVLEINGGEADKLGIKKDDKIEIFLQGKD